MIQRHTWSAGGSNATIQRKQYNVKQTFKEMSVAFMQLNQFDVFLFCNCRHSHETSGLNYLDFAKQETESTTTKM